MGLEIEAKISVSSLKSIEERLVKLGAESIHTVKQKDTYLVDNEGFIKNSGIGLRLRRQEEKEGELFILTFKGPKLGGRFKSRQEVEIRVSDFDAALQIFLGLGYIPSVTVEKIRKIWKWDYCSVCLDEVMKLGYYVEIEGPSEEQVHKVLNQLDLADQPHISSGYAKLTAEAEHRVPKN